MAGALHSKSHSSAAHVDKKGNRSVKNRLRVLIVDCMHVLKLLNGWDFGSRAVYWVWWMFLGSVRGRVFAAHLPNTCEYEVGRR